MNQHERSAKTVGVVSVGVLVCAMVCQWAVMWSTTDKLSPTPDEYAHLASGISYFQTGSHYLYSVNPPLVKRVAAYGLFAKSMRIDAVPDEMNWIRAEWEAGTIFSERYGAGAFAAVVEARRRVLWFAIIGTLGVFLLTRHLIGWGAAAIAAVLWASSPWVLGYGMLVQTDVPAGAMGVWAIYALAIAMQRANLASCLMAGICLGLAVLTKFTWLIAWPVWPLLALCTWKGASASPRRRFGMGCFICVISWFVLLAGYHFDDVGRPLGGFAFASKTLGGKGGLTAQGNRFDGTVLESLPVPVPGAVLKGVDWQLRDVQNDNQNMLFGEWKNGGWWYYYFVVLAIKTRLSALALFVVGGWLAWRRRRASLLPVAIMASVLMVLISRHTGMNSHGRYLLPILPLGFIIASYTWQRMETERDDPPVRSWLGISRCHAGITCLVLIGLIETAVGFPYLISYSNAAFGGSANTHRWLAGSNVNWDHGWIEIREWLESEQAKDVEVHAFFPSYVRLKPLGMRSDEFPPVSRLEDLSEDALVISSLTYFPRESERNSSLTKPVPIRTFAHSMGLYRVSEFDVRNRGLFLKRVTLVVEPVASDEKEADQLLGETNRVKPNAVR